MTRLPVLFVLLSAGALAQHRLPVPNGASAKERCEIKCQQKHRDSFIECGKVGDEEVLRRLCRERVHSERDRCLRTCAATALHGDRP